MDKVERPKSKKYIASFYTLDEVEKLFVAIKGDSCEFPVLMAAFYGLRRSEILGLRWQAVDFQNNLITINHTVVHCKIGKELIIAAKDRAKNKTSCRSMPLVPQFRDLLLQMKKRQESCRNLCGSSYTDSDYVFVNDMGIPYKPNYVTQHFQLVLKKNGLRIIRFHDLRHSFATIALGANIQQKVVQEILGHSSIRTTMDIYSHVMPSIQDSSLRLLEEAFKVN